MAGDRMKITRVKMRFKTGEEFEAEGDSGFISRQKEEFLQLIGKTPAPVFPPAQARPRETRPEYFEPPKFTPQPAPQTLPSAPVTPEYNAPENFVLPRHVRGPLPAAPSENAAQTMRPPAAVNALAVWNNVCAVEDDLVILRRKFKLLTPPLAALILLSAAKVLLKQNYYSSLKLAKSMKISGFMEDRLDRILSSEIRQGTVLFEGEKRNRVYQVADEGFARAFVLAEKLI